MRYVPRTRPRQPTLLQRCMTVGTSYRRPCIPGLIREQYRQIATVTDRARNGVQPSWLDPFYCVHSTKSLATRRPISEDAVPRMGQHSSTARIGVGCSPTRPDPFFNRLRAFSVIRRSEWATSPSRPSEMVVTL